MKHLTTSLAVVFAATLAVTTSAGVSAADKIKLTMNWTADSAHLGFGLPPISGPALKLEFGAG